MSDASQKAGETDVEDRLQYDDGDDENESPSDHLWRGDDRDENSHHDHAGYEVKEVPNDH